VERYRIPGAPGRLRPDAMAKTKPQEDVHVHGPDCDHGAPQGPVRNTEPKIGRNDPCPCGSGKKYKKCHGA
jgi:uncharacterized protein YecA (UPF0149 family)